VGARREIATSENIERPAPSLLALRDVLVVVLAATSGYIDAVSYLGLGRVFTSNMTGNTVLLGLALGQAQGVAALRSAVALAGYLGGVAGATLIVGREEGGKGSPVWPTAVTTAVTVEGGVLLLFAAGSLLARSSASGLVYPLIAVAAIAMGIQSVAVRALGVSGVATTYITGTWTSLLSGLVANAHPSTCAPMTTTPAATPALRVAYVQAAVLAVYVVAAVAGGVAEARWLLAAGALPVVMVALVAAIAWQRFPQASMPSESGATSGAE
jgi:uncharacterized membrane protein YoaK (UPF0700 family)